MKHNNRGYSPDLFTVSREAKDVALLAGVGRFCVCGCGKGLHGSWFKQRIKGKTIKYFRGLPKNQKFATKACQHRYYRSNNKVPLSKSSIPSRITLRTYDDGKPYRIISVYVKHGLKEDFKLREGTELWKILDRIEKVNRKNNKPKEERIAVQNL